MPEPIPGALYVFDAYGTLFDIHAAIMRYQDRIGPNATLISAAWRTKQMEYAWTRSLMGAYRDFEDLTAASLDHVMAVYRIDPALRTPLLDAYRVLDAFPDAKPALERLKAGGARLAILSNGTPGMVEAAAGAAGLGGLLDAILSVDTVKIYKTDPHVYRLVTNHFGGRPQDVDFVSSNRWDAAGASRFGFRTHWINRGGLPDDFPDIPVTRMLAALAEL